MCWKIDKKEFKKNPTCYHKIAEEDVVVYKVGGVIDGKFIPYFRHDFVYTANALNKEVKLGSDKGYEYVSIDEGYHSYSNRDRAFETLNCIMVFELDYNYYDKIVIAKFIIPKGSEYYKNEEDEMVSSQLIWTGESIPFIKLLNKYVLENR